MKRLFSLLLLILAGTAFAFAQDDPTTATSDRKPVTSKFEILLGNGSYASHFLNTQMYKGSMKGVEATFGRFYKKSDKVSWDLSLGHWRSKTLVNPARTSSISAQTYDVHYGAYYNWIIKNRLQIRLGGYLNANGCLVFGDSHFVNNTATLSIHAHLYAAAQLRYGWNFKKWGLDIYANAATPIIGARTADGTFMDFTHNVVPGQVKVTPYKHIVFSSMHNTLGVDWEMGIDFAMPRISLTLAYGQNALFWHDYGVQNTRNNNFFKLGVSVNLVGMHRGKTANRNF